jgi:hypothetical protein
MDFKPPTTITITVLLLCALLPFMARYLWYLKINVLPYY